MEDDLLSRQQVLPLHAASGSKGTASVDTAWAPTASQELPEWHYLAKPPSGLQLLVFILGFTPLAFPRTGRPQGSSGAMS